MSFPSHVRLVEVGPRDGLQNEKQPISVADKVALINALSDSGLSYIEAGSFVSPKWVPQMAGSAEVFGQIQRAEAITYAALTPNMQGFEAAMAAGVKEVAVFAAASESFSQKNINCSISESLKRFEPLMDAAKQQGIRVRGYVSCVLGCPYEGEIAPEQVRSVAQALYNMGCYIIWAAMKYLWVTPLVWVRRIKQRRYLLRLLKISRVHIWLDTSMIPMVKL